MSESPHGHQHKALTYKRAAASVKGIAGELVTLTERGGKFFPNGTNVALNNVAAVIGGIIRQKMDEFAAKQAEQAQARAALVAGRTAAAVAPVRFKVLTDGVVPTAFDEAVAWLLRAEMPPIACQDLREHGFDHILCFTSELAGDSVGFLPIGLRLLVTGLSQDIAHLIGLPANLRLNFLFKKRVDSISALLAQHFADKKDAYAALLEQHYVTRLDMLAELSPVELAAACKILIGQAVALVFGAKLAMRQKAYLEAQQQPPQQQ